MAITNKDLITVIGNGGKLAFTLTGGPDGISTTTDEVAYAIQGSKDDGITGVTSLTDKLASIDSEIYNTKTSADSSVKGVDDNTNKVTLASGEVLTTGRSLKQLLI